MKSEEFNDLFKKYESGTLSEQERKLLEKWYNHLSAQSNQSVDSVELKKRLESIAVKIPVSYPAKIRKMYYRITAAASILVILGLMTWLLYDKNSTTDQLTQVHIAPGSNKAVLSLADGRTINLSEAQSGLIVNGQDINYPDGSKVVSVDNSASNRSALLELRTPQGGTYQITLSDGTKVWLNAASALRYPTRFNEKLREVEISGEAYFEVKPDSRRPFKVFSKGQEIRVLGTAFNVQAYTDEAEIKTTLVEGSVQITNQNSLAVHRLKPGDQSMVLDRKTTVSQVEVAEYTAWKEGLFRYNNQPLESIMRNISRWYQVKVVYENESLKSERFVGMVSRYTNISEALAVLEEVGAARFLIKDNTVIVRQK